MDYVNVIRDFRSGVLDKEKVELYIDNDGGYWVSHDPDDDKAEAIVEKLDETYGSPEGYSDVVKILCAAGVPAEWV